jgi:hypothetical protein
LDAPGELAAADDLGEFGEQHETGVQRDALLARGIDRPAVAAALLTPGMLVSS